MELAEKHLGNVNDLSELPVLDERYLLLETLGNGAFSSVKLGIELKTGFPFAIKIFKKFSRVTESKVKGEPPLIQEDNTVCMKNFLNEVGSLKKLKHPNLINLIDCSDKGTILQQRGSHKKVTLNVIYLVLELAVSGELFDYVALSGRFSEPVARYYFR